MLLYENIYRVALFGHRDFYAHRRLDDTLYPLLKDLLRTKPFVEIYIGRDGEFDRYAASVVKRVQDAMGKERCELNFVLPYKKKDIEYYEDYYDEIMIPESIGKAHYKNAITLRNRWMVDQADLVIVNVERHSGGAYTAMRYAAKQNKQIINLYELEEE